MIADDLLLRTGMILSIQKNKKLSHIVICQGYLEDRSYTEFWPSYMAYALKYRY